MLTFTVDPLDVGIFLAILIRISLLVFMLPLFANARVPPVVKAAVVLVLTAMLHPLLRRDVMPLSFEPVALTWLVLGEIVLGMVLGLSMLMILAAFNLAGELISYLTGLGFVQVVDPQNSSPTSVLSSLLQVLAMLLLLNLNGHHLMLRSVVESFQVAPIGRFNLETIQFGKLLAVYGQLFVVAVKLAAPVMVVLLLSQVGFGLIARYVPNINILVTSFPITILLGLFFTALALPLWGSTIERLFHDFFGMVKGALE